MSFEIVHVFPHEMLLDTEGTSCISLYQPTHRHGPENQQDLIRFKNLIQQIEQSLEEKFSKEEIEQKMIPFYELGEDHQFWEHAGEGLAVFAADDKCIVYKLQRPVEEFAVVADSFHIKPLIRVYQSADRYHLLGLSRESFAIYEGNRYHVEKIDMDEEIKNTAKKALGEDYDDKVVTATGSGPTNETMLHGQGSRKDVIHKVTEKFFRIADSEVIKHFSNPMQLPVYLVALDEYHTLFQNVSKNNYLQKEGIKFDYQAMEEDDLKKAAWEVLEPIYIQKTHDLVEQFENARAKDEGSDDIAQVARAATEGRIHRILVEADKIYPGQVDLETGELLDASIENPEVDDVLDDIAELVFKQKGEVVVIPKERMPSETGVAAIYRY